MTNPVSNAGQDRPVIQDDPFGLIKQEANRKGLDPRSINQAHANSDKDTSQAAQHHTLGASRNQASPGDHIHDGRQSKKLGTGLTLTITGSRGGNAALASLIAALKQVIEITDSTTV